MCKYRNILRFPCMAALCVAFCSCVFLHDDRVVARVYSKKLYESQVLKFIPPGSSPEDSAALARQYINAWAGELIMNAMADKQLSKKEKDVTKELEEYRTALLKYRYEQHYIEDRLDTVVTDEQIAAHYENNAKLYTLDVPIVKGAYIRIPAGSPNKDMLKKMMSSKKDEDRILLDSLSFTLADKYTRYSDKWIDIVVLARDFGMDYGTLLGARRGDFIELEDEQGMEHVAYIGGFIGGGKVPPLEYCEEKIRDVIIGQRKYVLSSTLEQALLDDALEHGTFEIYENEEDE